MATDPQRTAEAARRALEDANFAKAVLEGRENYPEVRQAIIADLSTSNDEEVKAYSLNFASASPVSSARALDTYIQNGPKPGGMNLVELINKANIRGMEPKPW
jgi:hypothetical protein